MMQFAVAVTLTKQKPGSIGIMTWLRVLSASSKDEAIGIGIQQALADNEGYDVHVFIAAPVCAKVEG